MLPHKHVAISTVIGAVAWWGTGTPAAGAVALLGGVLPDVDHVLDYSYYVWRHEHRLILLLHGYEFAILGASLALRTGDIILGVAVFSYFVHLLADQTENRTRALGYSLLFRVWNRFRIDRLSTMPEAAIRGRLEDMQLLRKLVNRKQP